MATGKSPYHSKTLFLRVLLVSLLLVFCVLKEIPTSSGQGTGQISGTVTDSSTGKGIPSALVCADGHCNTTDENGDYSISNLAPGPYEVRATVSGYAGELRTVTIYAGIPTPPANFQLDPLSIAGRVHDASTGVGIAFANLTADDFSTRANSTGHYMFIDLPIGTYSVTAMAPGYASQSKQAMVSHGDTAIVNFPLGSTPPGTVLGTVTDSLTGLAIPNAEITLYAQWTEGYELSNRTDQSGHYVIEGVPAWPYWELEAYAMGYALQSRLIAVACGSVNVEDFELDPLGRINGTVSDAGTGEPLAGALVKANGYRNNTDAEGHYVIWNVESGTYNVTASAPGYTSEKESNVEVRVAETTTVNFELTAVPPGKIEGYVTDIKTGEGISGAVVTADGHSNTTESYGYYLLSNVPAWTYTVTASAEEYMTEEAKRTVPPGGTATASFQLTPVTKTFVAPYLSYENPGQNFTVSVNITAARLVYKWQFYIRWEATLLNLTEVEEGGFLKGPTGDRPTDFSVYPYQNEGYMKAIEDSSLAEPDNGVNGSGTLARLTFEVEEKGKCSLVLYWVTLYDASGSMSFPLEVEGGVFDSLPGDINSDGIVDIYDLARIGKAYGTTPGASNWDAEADINCDTIIDDYDLALCGETYGNTE